MSRISVLFFIACLSTSLSSAKDKVVLPADVLRAQTVAVFIQPEAGEPLTDPDANRRAQDDVERALTKWGRFDVVMSSQTADLIIAVRRGPGRAMTPTISGGPIDNRPVVLQPGQGGDIRIGGQHGHPPDLSQTEANNPQNTQPHVHTEVGPSEDMMEVYRGRVDYPLDNPPVWRYIAKDALLSPGVPAVEQFRKVLDEAEKSASQKRQKQKP
jgi:hypothetical protein